MLAFVSDILLNIPSKVVVFDVWESWDKNGKFALIRLF
jgi:hypothetical protein